MKPRIAVKSIHEFAEREFLEKRAQKVVACRVKMKLIMRRGRAPDFRVRGIEGAKYLVCVFRGDKLRVYFMDGSGAMLGAEEFDGDEKERIFGEILRSSSPFLHIP